MRTRWSPFAPVGRPCHGLEYVPFRAVRCVLCLSIAAVPQNTGTQRDDQADLDSVRGVNLISIQCTSKLVAAGARFESGSQTETVVERRGQHSGRTLWSLDSLCTGRTWRTLRTGGPCSALRTHGADESVIGTSVVRLLHDPPGDRQSVLTGCGSRHGKAEINEGDGRLPRVSRLRLHGKRPTAVCARISSRALRERNSSQHTECDNQ